MTFAHYEIAAGAALLHEHQPEQEEVWHIVEGEVALCIDGEEQVLTAGCVAVVPPDTPHAVRPLGACRAIIADYPLRPSLPGLAHPLQGAARSRVDATRLAACMVESAGRSHPS